VQWEYHHLLAVIKPIDSGFSGDGKRGPQANGQASQKAAHTSQIASSIPFHYILTENNLIAVTFIECPQAKKFLLLA